jgi:hypothetical protein
MKDRRLAIIMLGLLAAPLLEACAGGSSSGGEADWSSFSTLDRPWLTASSLDDLSRKAGFRFVLPSYVPPGVSHEFFLSSQVPGLEGGGSVSLIPDDNASRDIQIGIQIDEDLRPSWIPRATGYSQDYEVHRIGGILVGCLTEEPNETWPTPAPNEGYPAGLTCGWDTEQLLFRVQFGWRTESGATPEVTPERRDEAMKVITSMIEDPYLP